MIWDKYGIYFLYEFVIKWERQKKNVIAVLSFGIFNYNLESFLWPLLLTLCLRQLFFCCFHWNFIWDKVNHLLQKDRKTDLNASIARWFVLQETSSVGCIMAHKKGASQWCFYAHTCCLHPVWMTSLWRAYGGSGFAIIACCPVKCLVMLFTSSSNNYPPPPPLSTPLCWT